VNSKPGELNARGVVCRSPGIGLWSQKDFFKPSLSRFVVKFTTIAHHLSNIAMQEEVCLTL